MSLKNKSLKQKDLLPIIQAIRELGQMGSRETGPWPCHNMDEILQTLLEGEMEIEGLMPWSSNYTFLVVIKPVTTQTELFGIYKPCAGERPLWDFPEGSLCHREFGSYLISQVLGWPNIPCTVLRDGPHGPGAVQLFIEAEYEAHYFNMRHSSAFTEIFREIALFDYIVNNADRKGGHCLKDKNGQLWAIDHGLTFHTDFKLRTVIWEFCNEPIPVPLIKDLVRLQQSLNNRSALWQILSQLISLSEIQALQKRIELLLSSEHFPNLRPGRNVPFPPI